MSSKEETLNPDNANRLIQGMMHRLHNNRMAKANSVLTHNQKKSIRNVVSGRLFDKKPSKQSRINTAKSMALEQAQYNKNNK